MKLTYQVWDKVSPIKGFEADYWKKSLNIGEQDGVFIILNNGVVERVEIDTIIKANYSLDVNLTTEEVAIKYLEKKAQEEEEAKNAQTSVEQQGQEIQAIKKEQADLMFTLMENNVL